MKQRKLTKTHFDTKNNIWSIKEKNGGILFFFDNRPHWNLSYDRLVKSLREVPCKFYLPKINDIVIDIGPGVGTESLIFSNLVGRHGKVFAIEAHPATCRLLKMMVVKNLLNNVFVFNAAVSDISGTVYIDNLINHESNKINKANTVANAYEIKAITLDEFIDQNAIKKIDLLKMNIEGAELEAIQGMKKSITLIKNIAVSCHDFLSCGTNQKIFKSYYQFLSEKNFEIYTDNTGHVVRDSWIYGKNNNL